MLSLHQAIEIQASIIAYLKATFGFQDKKVEKAFDAFIHDPQEGLFKGPYLSLQPGFVKVDEATQAAVPLDIKPDWRAYDHQIKTWQRLSTHDQEPQPTLITTGTGSGKTESFLFPMLDYCYRQQHRPGIKVIILYPMNALASDQAKRLAEAIDEDARLKGKITAGLFIGEGKNETKYPKSMGPDHIIENRESILASPPDILLTNFKMLDYGLMKHNYHDLWAYNLQDTGLLRFLVLDELHTYDGAQGTDVANLIRRLKLKLNLPAGQLCPVGTSATIGSGEEAPVLLAEYGSRIFGESISPEAIITENRISPEAFFGLDEELDPFIPRAMRLKDSMLRKDEAFEDFIQRQVDLWQLDANELANGLRKQLIVKHLVQVINEGTGIHTLDEIERELSRLNPRFRELPQWDESEQFAPRRALLESLYALVSIAKENDGRDSPFLFARTQLWIRELSGLLRVFGHEPQFIWRDLAEKQETKALPPWFCRECGATGWLAVKQDNREQFEQDINDLYQKFFSNNKNLYFVSAFADFNPQDLKLSGYEHTDMVHEFVDQHNLLFHDESDPERIEVMAVRKLDSKNRNDHVCPACNTRNTVSIIGTRIATLSSIAMSQTLATDLDMQDERERKVLAFTNSVQDAAHQAGFVEARNYRFTLRSSLQQVINAQEGPLSLSELAEQFKAHWKTRADESGQQSLPAYFYRFFPKDYIGKASPADYAEKERYETHFQKEFDMRVDWEIFAEFGYDSLIGRTLEKTGSSAAYFQPEALARTWALAEDWLQVHDPARKVDRADFERFLLLMLHRVRVRGAVSHPFLEKFRSQDLKLWDLNWISDTRHFLNKRFGPRTRLPKLLTSQVENRGLLDSTFARTTNWFHSYFKKCFEMANDKVDFINEFYAMLLPAMEASGLLDKRQTLDLVNYALRPASIFVGKEVHALSCKRCGHEVHGGAPVQQAAGGHCLNYRCQGTYELQAQPEENYYQAVYNRKRAPRIYAKDHTGLLDRQVREELEDDFKYRPKFNSTNAMVATSTLEMGIDIGTLNAVYNNSVPPLPSNFLQRIGRAGRKSGSAFVINFAQNKAHDLFYFQGPYDMMAGEVATPGCFLEAKEILRRHFFAYCIDSWTSLAPKKHHLPVQLRSLKLETLDLQDASFFMNRLLNYIKLNEEALFSRFRGQYVGEVKEEVFAELQYQLDSEQFYEDYKAIFKRIKQEIANIRQKQQETVDMIKTLKLGKEDPERLEMERERKNLGGIIKSIRDRHTLEHLTNVGALPNYAFPETGVTLSARVLGTQAEGSTHDPMQKDFEMVRAASQALREFAPDNYFYSQGFRFQASGINTYDWADNSVFHSKRFCSQCDHIEINSLAAKGNCPKCGHESWGASSNVHEFAKLLTVKSFNNQAKAALNDSKDEREALIYHRLRHFKFDPSRSRGAWALVEIPFGIEFVKSVTILESNLGRSDVTDARKLQINELEVPVHGFITCRHCGKSSSHINQYEYKQHFGYCKHKNEEYKGKSDAVFKEVFFFREMTTEALKVLLPVQELDSEAKVKMFKAGIERGLKDFYKGNPQHIEIAEYKEYNHKSMRFDRYLVLFDKVPGGTGYLEQLFDRSEFTKLMKQAYESIRDCSCQHEGKDGCYRCIYSYGNQYYHADLSRAEAEKSFRAIVEKSETWERQSEGLSQIAATGRIEESELEERFIRSLSKFASKEAQWKFQEKNEDGTVSYSLSYRSPLTQVSYHIRPQVELGRVDGIAYYTRSDFLIVCTEATLDGQNYQDTIPSIAVYLDGYQFHASTENNRFFNDFQKRQAINAHDGYHSWTLTWDDLEKFDQRFLDAKEQKDRKDFLRLLLEEEGYKDSRKQLLNMSKGKTMDIGHAPNNLERLLLLLQYPFRDKQMKASWNLFLATYQPSLFRPSFPPQEMEKAFDYSVQEGSFCLQQKTLDGWLRVQALPACELFVWRTIANIQQHEVASRLLLRRIDEIPKAGWNQFWLYYNLIQFFPLEEVETFDLLPEMELDMVNMEGLEDFIDLFEPAYADLIRQLFQKGLVRSEDEDALSILLDEKGGELATAELIIPHLQLAFEPHDPAAFQKAGYTILTQDQIKEINL